MYTLHSFKDALRTKNWTILNKLLVNARAGEALFMLSHMLTALETEVYRHVKSRYFSTWIAKSSGLLGDWKTYMQGNDYRLMTNVIGAHPSTFALHRAAFLANIKTHKSYIKDWVKLELLQFSAENIQALTREF